MNLNEVNSQNFACYYFNDLNKFEDLNLDNILIDDNSNENIFFITIRKKV